MQLIASPDSPFVHEVRVPLHESSLAAQVAVVNVATPPMHTDPPGRSAALLREDGATLHDTLAITRDRDAPAGAGVCPETRPQGMPAPQAAAEAL